MLFSSSTDPSKHSCIQYGEKFYPVNRNLINLIKINVSQMTLRPAGYPRLQMAKCSVEMDAVLHFHVLESQDQPVIKKEKILSKEERRLYQPAAVWLGTGDSWESVGWHVEGRVPCGNVWPYRKSMRLNLLYGEVTALEHLY